MNIRKLPSGRFQARVQPKGADRLSKTFDTEAQALRWAKDQERTIRSGDWADPALGELPVWHFAQLFWDARKVEPNTAATDRSRMENHVDPRWGNVPVGSIQNIQVKAWVKHLQAPKGERFRTADGRIVIGAGLGWHSTKGCLNLLRQILEVAFEQGAVKRNEAAGIGVKGESRREKRFLTRDEANALIDAMPDRWRVLVLTGFDTGMRWGELLGLKVRNVDLLHQEIRVRDVVQEVGGKFIDKSYPKSEAGRREIPIRGRLAKALTEHLADAGGPTSKVFTGQRGTTPARSTFADRVWKPALVRAEIAEPWPTPHDMRHSFISWMANGGVPTAVVKRVAGHESLATTELYLHPGEDEKDMVRAALDGALVGARWIPLDDAADEAEVDE